MQYFLLGHLKEFNESKADDIYESDSNTYRVRVGTVLIGFCHSSVIYAVRCSWLLSRPILTFCRLGLPLAQGWGTSGSQVNLGPIRGSNLAHEDIFHKPHPPVASAHGQGSILLGAASLVGSTLAK